MKQLFQYRTSIIEVITKHNELCTQYTSALKIAFLEHSSPFAIISKH